MNRPAPAQRPLVVGERPTGKPGRKPGSTLQVLAPALQPADFKLLHAHLQGLDLKAAHARYAAAPEAASDDRRHLAHALRALVQRVEVVAGARGQGTLARQALAGLGAAPAHRVDRRREVEALARLAERLLEPPARSDGLAAWLAADLPGRFMHAQMNGKTTPLVTLGNLVDFVNLQGHRWWRTVPRLGARRAARILAWLVPVAEALGSPVHERARTQAALQRIGRENRRDLALQTRDGAAHRSFALVALSELAIPEALSGRTGTFRSADANTLGAETDAEAIAVWLARHHERRRTQQLYTRIVERFYLWCLLVRRKPLSSVDEQDMMAYKAFLMAPPADWVQRRHTARGSPEWRPLRGALSASTTRLDMSVIASLFSELHKAGYLRAQAGGAVKRGMKLPHMTIDIRRSFDHAQWAGVMAYWSTQYARCGPPRQGGTDNVTLPGPGNEDQDPYRAALLRRTRLLLELGASTGLRLSEMSTTRRSALETVTVDGEEATLLHVVGKGNKARKVVLFDDVRALLEQHHEDMAARDTAFEPETPGVRALHGELGALAHARPAAAHRPLIGALRRPPGRWQRDQRGVASLAPGRLADRFGALDPSALYQSLKRFLAACARDAARRGEHDHAEDLRRASTHWLRHFFANSAVADGVEVSTLRDAMGHASLTTTSVYLHTESQRMVREMAKMRRR